MTASRDLSRSAPATWTTTIYTQWQSRVLWFLLIVKIIVAGANAFTFDIRDQYDAGMHFSRTATCGIYTSERYYNPPGYYLLACPAVVGALASEVDLLAEARAVFAGDTSFDQIIDKYKHNIKAEYLSVNFARPIYHTLNVIMLFGLYWFCAFYIFPKFLPSVMSAVTASVILFALPGFQKLAAMTHPDNLFVFLTILMFALWCRFAARGELKLREAVILGLLAGAAALTRPFSIVPVGAMGAVLALETWIAIRGSNKDLRRRFVIRLLAFALVAGSLGGAWWGYRYVATGTVVAMFASEHEVASTFESREKDFDYGAFYSTFHIADLLETPNRTFGDGGTDWRVSNNNSFFTLFYSDFWGDHWLYFSGPRLVEAKAGVKRALLAYALLVTPLLLYCAFRGLWVTGRQVLAGQEWTHQLFVILVAVGSVVVYMVWTATHGVEPGKNSAIKFIYLAYAIPFLLMLVGAGLPIGRTAGRVGLALSLVLFAVAFPVSLYW